MIPDREPGIGPLQHDEPLSRYITDRDYMKETAQASRAFRPKPADSELPIGRIEELDDDGIWALGDALTGSGDRAVHGRRDINLTVVRAARIPAAQLDAESTPEPSRHARIIGWPPGASVDGRKALVMMLYASSVLHARPSTINPFLFLIIPPASNPKGLSGNKRVILAADASRCNFARRRHNSSVVSIC